MSKLSESIEAAARAMPEGRLCLAADFLHLASRAAVCTALSRLARQGELLRVSRGVYVAPVKGRFGCRAPSTESVVRDLETRGETVVASGAAEANALGLSAQVPVREVFLTSGPSRILHLGNRSVEFKHAQAWQLRLGHAPAGRVIRALSWLGPDAAPAALGKLRQSLSRSEWEALREIRRELPSWLAHLLSKVLPDVSTKGGG